MRSSSVLLIADSPAAARFSFSVSMAWRTAGMPPRSTSSAIGWCSAGRLVEHGLAVHATRAQPLGLGPLGQLGRRRPAGPAVGTGAITTVTSGAVGTRPALAGRAVGTRPALAVGTVGARPPITSVGRPAAVAGGPVTRGTLTSGPAATRAIASLATVAVGTVTTRTPIAAVAPAAIAVVAQGSGQLRGHELVVVGATGADHFDALGLGAGAGLRRADARDRHAFELDVDLGAQRRRRPWPHRGSSDAVEDAARLAGRPQLATSRCRRRGRSSARSRSGGT